MHYSQPVHSNSLKCDCTNLVTSYVSNSYSYTFTIVVIVSLWCHLYNFLHVAIKASVCMVFIFKLLYFHIVVIILQDSVYSVPGTS